MNKQLAFALALTLGGVSLHAEGDSKTPTQCHKPTSPCEKTCFEDLGVGGTLLAREIAPSYTDECGQCYEDVRPEAVTCFKRSVAIEPKPFNKLLANYLCPVKYGSSVFR